MFIPQFATCAAHVLHAISRSVPILKIKEDNLDITGAEWNLDRDDIWGTLTLFSIGFSITSWGDFYKNGLFITNDPISTTISEQFWSVVYMLLMFCIRDALKKRCSRPGKKESENNTPKPLTENFKENFPSFLGAANAITPWNYGAWFGVVLFTACGYSPLQAAFGACFFTGQFEIITQFSNQYLMNKWKVGEQPFGKMLGWSFFTAYITPSLTIAMLAYFQFNYSTQTFNSPLATPTNLIIGTTICMLLGYVIVGATLIWTTKKKESANKVEPSISGAAAPLLKKSSQSLEVESDGSLGDQSSRKSVCKISDDAKFIIAGLCACAAIGWKPGAIWQVVSACFMILTGAMANNGYPTYAFLSLPLFVYALAGGKSISLAVGTLNFWPGMKGVPELRDVILHRFFNKRAGDNDTKASNAETPIPGTGAGAATATATATV